MDYGLIITFAAFLGAIQLATRFNAGPLICSFVAVGIPYLIGFITNWIINSAHALPTIGSLFSLSSVITVVLQFFIAVIVFKKLRDEDDLPTVVGWALGGLIVIVGLIPFIVQKIV